MIPYINITLMLGGKLLEITHTSVWRLVSITGIEAADMTPYIEDYASRDGAWYGGEHVHPRYITLTVQCSPKSQTEQRRHEMISFLDPHASGELTVDRSGVRRKIGVRMAAGASFEQPNIRMDRLRVSIQLVAPIPWWEDPEETEFQFLLYRPMINFPFSAGYETGGQTYGATAGMLVHTTEMNLVNDGDVPVGVRCIMKCTGGSTVRPKITAGGKFVKALTTLTSGDVLVIDTNVGNKSITKNGVRQMIFSADSEFFQIPVGSTSVSVSADSGIEYCETSFVYSLRYLGV